MIIDAFSYFNEREIAQLRVKYLSELIDIISSSLINLNETISLLESSLTFSYNLEKRIFFIGP